MHGFVKKFVKNGMNGKYLALGRYIILVTSMILLSVFVLWALKAQGQPLCRSTEIRCERKYVAASDTYVVVCYEYCLD